MPSKKGTVETKGIKNIQKTAQQVIALPVIRDNRSKCKENENQMTAVSARDNYTSYLDAVLHIRYIRSRPATQATHIISSRDPSTLVSFFE